MLHEGWMNFETAKVGDLVRGDFIEEQMECLPPACMRESCSQTGEPYSHRDDEVGRWRPTYSTWHLVELHDHDSWSHNSIWMFDGMCFRGTNVNREPQYA